MPASPGPPSLPCLVARPFYEGGFSQVMNDDAISVLGGPKSEADLLFYETINAAGIEVDDWISECAL